MTKTAKAIVEQVEAKYPRSWKDKAPLLRSYMKKKRGLYMAQLLEKP